MAASGAGVKTCVPFTLSTHKTIWVFSFQICALAKNNLYKQYDRNKIKETSLLWYKYF